MTMNPNSFDCKIDDGISFPEPKAMIAWITSLVGYVRKRSKNEDEFKVKKIFRRATTGIFKYVADWGLFPLYMLSNHAVQL